MSKAFTKKSLLITAGLCGFLLIGKTTAQAAVEFTLIENITTPGYVYNAGSGILAIPADQANNYTTTLLTAGVDDGFIMPSGANNLYNNVVNDSNAILGYAWSERVGWLSFSHGMINGVEKYYPRFAKDADGSQDILKGYVWSEYSGWIQLSSDNFEASTAQSDTNWGVIFNETGFSGRAWGAALGWIDFSKVTYDSVTGKFVGFACSANDHDADNNGLCDTSSNNKIDFKKVPQSPPGLTSVGLIGWGVSKNMSYVKDDFNAVTCDLLHDVCAGSDKATLIATANGSSVSLNFANRLYNLIGNHDLKIRVTNLFGQTYELKNPATNTETVRFKSVVWPVNCYLNGGNFVCDAPVINFNTDHNGAIADGVDVLKLTTSLTNGASQAVFAAPGSNNVNDIMLELNFEDTVEINQLDAVNTYDAVNYSGTNLLSTNRTTSDVVVLTLDSNGTNGDFITDMTSLAPTDASNQLILKDFSITITLDEDAPLATKTFTFTKTVNYPNIPDQELNFSPALTAIISNFDHLIENTSSVFNVTLTNHSTTQDLSKIDLNTMFEGILANVIAEIKAKPASSAYTDIAIDQLQLVSNDLSGNYLINPSGAIVSGTEILEQSLIANASQELTFDLKPLLVLGYQIDTTKSITFETQVAYDIAGASETTYHKSHLLDLVNNVLTSQIDIKGLASGKQIFDINTNYNINVSGGMTFEEVSEAIRKNVADITRNETPTHLNAGASTSKIGNWNEGNQIKNGTVLYYEGNGGVGELIIGTGSDFVIGDNQGSIIVIGGNVYIKNNITYNGSKGSFGLIVIKDKNGKGGNVYIDPAVTNLVGGIYAEGSLMSALDNPNNGTIDDTEIFDGFSDTAEKALLGNQIYINGSLISRNTIGGSRQNPIEFPKGYNATSCGGNDAQKCAERYDLNYIRNFAATSTGAVINGTRATNESNSAFFIKYDPRIQTSTPPGFQMQGKMQFEEIVK